MTTADFDQHTKGSHHHQQECSWIGPRIIDKINAAVKDGQRFYALEFFPPSTIEGARNLIPRMDRLAQLQVGWIMETTDHYLCREARFFFQSQFN